MYIDLTSATERLTLEHTDTALELDMTDAFDLEVCALFLYHGNAEAAAERAVRSACRECRAGGFKGGIKGHYVEMYNDPQRAGPEP